MTQEKIKGIQLVLMVIGAFVCLGIGYRLIKGEQAIEPQPLPLPAPAEQWENLPRSLQECDVQWCPRTGFIRILPKEVESDDFR